MRAGRRPSAPHSRYSIFQPDCSSSAIRPSPSCGLAMGRAPDARTQSARPASGSRKPSVCSGQRLARRRRDARVPCASVSVTASPSRTMRATPCLSELVIITLIVASAVAPGKVAGGRFVAGIAPQSDRELELGFGRRDAGIASRRMRQRGAPQRRCKHAWHSRVLYFLEALDGLASACRCRGSPRAPRARCPRLRMRSPSTQSTSPRCAPIFAVGTALPRATRSVLRRALQVAHAVEHPAQASP